jgi:polyhydroxybutyrate depolymerase
MSHERTRRIGPRAALLLPVTAVLATACGGGSPSLPPTRVSALGPTHSQITVGGQQRTYRVYRASSVNSRTPAPLVLVLHGNASNGDQMAGTTEFDVTADTNGFIAVYPDGTEKSWNGSFCCEPAPTLGVDDLAFLNALIPQLEHDYTIDRRHVFITGFSSGAIMAYRYACQGSVPIAAIAPVAGTMLLDQPCSPKQPLSVLAVNGTTDGEVPYQGGHLLRGASATDQIVPSAPSVAALWAQLDKCGATASTRTSEPVSTTVWTGCTGGATVTLETITGAGHTWYANGFGPADGAIDASTLIGDFFEHVTKGSG